MSYPFEFRTVNGSQACFVYPRPQFPDGLYLTYDNCPEEYDNSTSKIVRYCCLNILFSSIQDSVYKRTQDWLRYHGSSALVAPAVLFNILSLFVLSTFKGGKNSTTFYMKCLCIFDALTIIAKFLYEVIVVRNGLRQQPIVINSFLCKFLSFSEGLLAISSIYLLIAMSVDKLICVLMPLKVSQLLTQNKAKVVVSCILLVSGLISSYNLFDMRVWILETDSNSNRTNSSSPRYFYDCGSNYPDLKNDWVLVNNIIRVFLPLLMLCICNSWIVLAISKAKKKTDAMFGEASRREPGALARANNRRSTDEIDAFDPDSSEQERRRRISMAAKTCQERRKKDSLGSKSIAYQTAAPARSRNNTHHISIMLFTISLGFVLLNLPFAIRTLFHRQFQEQFRIVDYVYHAENLFTIHVSKTEIVNSVKYEFFSSLTHFLLDLNYIANFFLYIFSGSRFRSQLLIMLRLRAPKESAYATVYLRRQSQAPSLNQQVNLEVRENTGWSSTSLIGRWFGRRQTALSTSVRYQHQTRLNSVLPGQYRRDSDFNSTEHRNSVL
nr:G protein-coupled receptor [Proales similis]